MPALDAEPILRRDLRHGVVRLPICLAGLLNRTFRLRGGVLPPVLPDVCHGGHWPGEKA